tara:strand:- start:762 stop:914 length:153 start_codon:yes stop_codon:yes gene_type:complete
MVLIFIKPSYMNLAENLIHPSQKVIFKPRERLKTKQRAISRELAFLLSII